jgi:hypothetical protein
MTRHAETNRQFLSGVAVALGLFVLGPLGMVCVERWMAPLWGWQLLDARFCQTDAPKGAAVGVHDHVGIRYFLCCFNGPKATGAPGGFRHT